jgi:hypothetical protein
VVVPASEPAVAPSASSGRVEVVFANGRHLIVDAEIVVVALARLVAVLEQP